MKLKSKLILVVLFLGAMSAYGQSYSWSKVGNHSQKDFNTVVGNFKFNGMVRLETRHMPDKVSACINDFLEKVLNTTIMSTYLSVGNIYRIDVDEYIVVIRITETGRTIDRIKYYWYLWVDRDIIHY
jgi:hypothetical protein